MRSDRPARRGLFIVLDGVDGCGKTTQAELLATALRRDPGGDVLHLREPGSTALGERLREILLSRELDLEAGVELLLFAAARRQMLRELVAPALARGAHVVCERFHASTFAYQAAAGGLTEEWVLELLERFAGAPSPDLVLVLELSAERASARRSGARDRIEDRGLDFQRAVAQGFRRYAEKVSSVRAIDGDRDVRAVHDEVLVEVRRAIR